MSQRSAGPFDVRKLAAIDIAFLGARFIIAEFAVGVLGPLALGVFIALRSHSVSGLLMGAYFLTLGVNYVPLLLYAVAISRAGSAAREIGDELAVDRRRARRKYRRGSMLLLIPLVVPVLAVIQERQRRRAAHR